MSADADLLETIAGALAEARLDAIVVGNAASELHGAPIATEEVDLLIRDTRLNKQKLKRLADALGGVSVDIHDLIKAKRIHLPDVFIDILFDKIGNGLTFNAIRSRATKIQIGKYTLTVASLEDVIKSTEAAGRRKDLAVLPILRDTLAVQRALKRV
jgi:hypothetical protein